MANAECGGSINLMVAREKIRLAKAAGDRLAMKEAMEALITAQKAHRRQTGCEEEH